MNKYATATAFCLLASMLLDTPRAFSSQAQEWRFNVYLDDKPIGYHNFEVKPDENGNRTVSIEANFDVKFLFINVYSYRHDNTEQWHQQCLNSIESNTDDNGKRYLIRGERQGEIFHLETDRQSTSLPDCVMTFAYWDPAILKADRLLNAQTGEYVDIEVTQINSEKIEIAGTPVLANRYRVATEVGDIDLWYAANDNRWLALESTTESGRTLRYRMN